MNISSTRIAFVITACLLCGLAALPAVAANPALDKARQAASHSEWEDAAKFAQQAVTEDPGNEDAWVLLADAQMAIGDTLQAVSDYEKALALDPKLPSAVLALTQYYLKVDRLSSADSVVSAAQDKDKKGKFDEIKVARGLIYARLDSMAEATKILASAAAKNPKNPLYPQILARIYEDKKVHDLSEKYYADAWKLAPGDAGLAYEYGLVLQEQRKYDEALNLFKEVQTKDPKNRTVDYMVGRLYFAAKRWAEAATQFEKAVEKRPDHFSSWFLLGRSYFEFSKEEKKNFYHNAEKALRKAVALRPERKDATALLGETLLTQGRIYYQLALSDTARARALLDTSLQFCRDALLATPDQAGVYSQMGRSWTKAGNLDSAVVYHKLQLMRTPDDQTEFARLVSALQKKKDQAGLAETLAPVFNKLDWTLKKAPTDTLPNAQDKFIDRYAGVYANALIETGKSSQAREALKTMLAYNPQWCDGHSMNAYIDLKRERYADAVVALQAGVRSCPKDKDLWLSLGDSYYFSDPKNKENVKKAKEAYQRACALGSRDACSKVEQLK
jgi:cytochrome c-type biogenesis protein CcmH/NrfG